MSFIPDVTEIDKLFPKLREIQKETKTDVANMIEINDEDFSALEDLIQEMIVAFRFTGFNPKDFKQYLMTKVFIAPRFNKTTAEAMISAIIALFITRGNKLNSKNAGRMPEAGKSAIKQIEDKLGALFKVRYNPEELDDKAITPARIAATFPVVTVNLIQKFPARVVGRPPIGLPKGLASSFAFSVAPHSCFNLIRGMGIWRDNFTLIINPKATSETAQFIAQASAYNFSRIALDSDYIDDPTRIKTVANLAEMQYNGETKSIEKLLTLYWVDLPQFTEKVVIHVPTTYDPREAVKLLTSKGFRVDFLKELGPSTTAKLAALAEALSAGFTETEAQIWKEETSKQPVEQRYDLSLIQTVGTLGGRDQGKSFETEAQKLFASTNQPGAVRMTALPSTEEVSAAFRRSAPAFLQATSKP